MKSSDKSEWDEARSEGNAFWPEVILVPHLHPGLAQHGQALGVLQPQSGLQKLERLTGKLLVDCLDLCLEAEAKRQRVILKTYSPGFSFATHRMSKAEQLCFR